MSQDCCLINVRLYSIMSLSEYREC